MADKPNNYELVYRTSALMKEIADLKQQIKQLSNQNEKAQSEIYRLESILALVPPESLPKGINYNIGGNTLRSRWRR
ncbi:MAG: hypothetical protein IJ150_10610 [Bacteroidales bacterium]|nr:hypothetical protein [Bacteroidales bacterium]